MSKKIVLFGAGGAGEHYIRNKKMAGDCEIIALVDNDIKKHGRKMFGKYTILPPKELSKLSFDKVVITSSSVYGITDQLIKELHIPKEMISCPPKSLLKPYRPFEDKKTREYAIEVLIYIVTLFKANSIRYFLDFGTLLGIVREGDLIHWDDDVDLSIWPEDSGIASKVLKKRLDHFPKHINVNWGIKLVSNRNQGVSSIELYLDNPLETSVKEFSVSIKIIRFDEINAYRSNNSAPKLHFLKHDYITFKNIRMRVPYDYKRYLDHHYGNWVKPRKDISFMDIPGYNDIESINTVDIRE